MVVFQNKKRIRLEIKELKKHVSEAQKQLDADAVFGKIELMPEFLKAQTVFMYWSLPDELPTHAYVEKWSANKQILLPAIVEEKMVLKNYISRSKMKSGLLGVQEPDEHESYEGSVDLVIVPGIAFDEKKERLGRGKGYYDNFLKSNRSYNVGVCFDFQLIDSVPVTADDIRMDKVVTPTRTVE